MQKNESHWLEIITVDLHLTDQSDAHVFPEYRSSSFRSNSARHAFFINTHIQWVDVFWENLFSVRMKNRCRHGHNYLASQQQSNVWLNLFLTFFFDGINFFTEEFFTEFTFPCERLESLDTLSSRSRDVTAVPLKCFVGRLAKLVVFVVVDGAKDVWCWAWSRCNSFRRLTVSR